MKPVSLSMRLGLTVSMMGAVLVVFLAVLAYLALSHELDSRAKGSLEKKMSQIEHSLLMDISTLEISQKPHALLDQVLGHDNLNLTVFNVDMSKQLLSFGADIPDHLATLSEPSASNKLSYTTGSEEAETHILAASKIMKLRDGESVSVLLTIERSNDEALLNAYLNSTIVAVPLLLVLIGISAWAIVQRGLSPLREFRKVAAMVSAQDLSHRLSVVKMPQELSELAHAINFMLHRLDSGVQQLSQFSDDLAHELRSPITNLMGKAQVTLSRERPAGEYKAVLESCTEELGRVTRIVSDMLFLAQVSHPATLVSFECILLEDEALKVIDLFSLLAEEKSVSIDVSGRGKVLGDRLMIQRAISNLLSNAIRHCPPGQSISIAIETQPEKVSLVVSNPGAGIESQHLPHIFDRFYRVDTSRSRAEGGTGLGLAIVRSIMSLHQGSADARVLQGQETIFRLTFPKYNAQISWKPEKIKE